MPLDLPRLDPADDTLLHHQVRRVVERLARRAEYAGGKQPLPPETTLAEQLGVSRGTVRRAIKTMEHEGLLTRRRGAGTWVRGSRVRTRLEAWYSFSGEMQSRSLSFELLDWHLVQAPAPEAAAGALAIDAGRRVWMLERRLGTGSTPTVAFTSWFAPAVDLSAFEPPTMRLYTYLSEACGLQVQRSHERITARAAEETDARRLGTDVGAALLVRRRDVFDAADRPVEYNEGVYRADRFEYTVDLERS